MDKAAPTRRWYAPWREAPVAAARDAADYGTAFGLEMSMAPDEADPSPSQAGPARPAADGWLQRLAAPRRTG